MTRLSRHAAVDAFAPTAPDAFALRRLANRLSSYAPADGPFPLRLPGCYAVRLSRMTAEPMYATLGPVGRLLDLMAQPEDADLLGPLVVDALKQ